MHPRFPDLSPLGTLFAIAAPDAPALIDIRLLEDIAAHPGHIPGAVTVDYTDLDTLFALASPAGAIVICHKGLKLSAGTVARLRNRGIPARRLTGGHLGWLDAGFPVTDKQPPGAIALPLDATPTEAAAAWAMQRFLAPRAELFEVPRSDVAGVAERFDAVLPTAADAPPLPGLAALLTEVAAPGNLFAAQLAGSSTPKAAFPCLDAAWRGRLAGLETA